MTEPSRESPEERGVVEFEGRCQMCGEVGRVVAIPSAPPPNELCSRCAIEYGETSREEDLDEG